MAKTTKNTKSIYEGIDREKDYALDQALKLVKSKAFAKFDETVEIAMNLNIDPRKAEQNIRGMLSLPHGTGKTLRVAVFAKGEAADKAKAAGADIVGSDELVEMIQAGNMPFERCIATPDMMGHVGKVGRLLGPKGLMPNPKLGTVTTNVEQAVKDAKAGQIEYRAEKTGIIHANVGKLSFNEKALAENIKALVSTIVKARPAGVKGTYVKKISLSSTMGPGVRVALNTIEEA